MTHWPVKSSKTRQAWPSARRLTAVQSVSIVCTTAAERTSMLSTTRIWAREKVRRLTAGVLTYVTEVEGIGRTYAIQNTTTHIDALRALQHDVDAISDQLNRHRDDLKYDEEQLKRANEWRAEAELDYDYRQ